MDWLTPAADGRQVATFRQASRSRPQNATTEVPLIQQSGDMVMVNDQAPAGDDQVDFERMTEEELLRGLEGMPPAESPGSQRNGF